jgi:hypothetical protein
LNNIRTLVATSRATMFAASGPVHVETKTFISYPDRFRVETKGAQVGETVQVYAEGQAWVKDASGARRRTPSSRIPRRASARRYEPPEARDAGT